MLFVGSFNVFMSFSTNEDVSRVLGFSSKVARNATNDSNSLTKLFISDALELERKVSKTSVTGEPTRAVQVNAPAEVRESAAKQSPTDRSVVHENVAARSG